MDRFRSVEVETPKKEERDAKRDIPIERHRGALDLTLAV
jgi:hypothetical protein